MPDYIVTWRINIEDVDTPEDAAREALAIQRDRTSGATVFDVAEYLVWSNGKTYTGPDVEVVL